MTPQEIIAAVLGRIAVPGRRYPRPLPADVARWYAYTVDGGHCILVLLDDDPVDTGDPQDRLVPAPVRAVLRAGYRLEGGYVVTDLPYDPTLGLIADEGDDEF